jgi:hypothetical protein
MALYDRIADRTGFVQYRHLLELTDPIRQARMRSLVSAEFKLLRIKPNHRC